MKSTCGKRGKAGMTVREMTFFPWDEIMALYGKVGWKNYTDRPDMLKKAFQNSLAVLGAYDGEKLTGILRAVGDGYSIVFIQDLLVDPAYHRQGIGTMLLNAIRERYPAVYQLELLADDTPEAKAFYGANGFKKVGETGCSAYVRIR